MASTPKKTIVSAVVEQSVQAELRKLADAADRSLSAEIASALRFHLEQAPHAGAEQASR